MLDVLSERAAAVFSIPAEAAFRTLLSLLVVYLCTSLPVFLWGVKKLLQKVQGSKVSAGTATDSSAAGSECTVPSASDAASLIAARRSIFPKDFTGQKVDRSVVEAMLEAANWAPTHGKTEPWRFVVLGRAAQEELLDLSLKVLERDCTPEEFTKKRAKIEGKRKSAFSKATYMIAICMKRHAIPGKEMPEWEEVCAVACAVQNMWLSMTAHGAAGYWSSWYTEARESLDVKQFLGLDEEDKCMGVFMVGHCADPGCYRSKRQSIADKVTWRV
ncbi:g11109 [Coccomyxa elongata]